MINCVLHNRSDSPSYSNTLSMPSATILTVCLSTGLAQHIHHVVQVSIG
ncbi:MAG: hypothetical protein HQM05_12965 [Magnetococcales bacterium]|nr:hypothetical protein [Magnetococcales bacterium]